MSRNNRKKRVDFKAFSKGEMTYFVILILLTLLLGAAIPVLLSSNMLFSIRTSRIYQANELSDEDLLSPISFSYIDEEKTEEKRSEAAAGIAPYFTYSYTASLTMSEKAQMVYDYLVNHKEITDDSLSVISSMLDKLSDESAYSSYAAIIRETVNHFIREGIFSYEEISYLIEKRETKLYVNESAELPYTFSGGTRLVDGVLTDNSAFPLIYQWLVTSYSETDSVELQVIAEIAQEIIQANIFYDEVYTESQREAARKMVEPVVINIEKGDYILKTDTLVTADQLYTLSVLNSKRVISMSFFSALPRVLLVVFVIGVWFYFSVGLIQYEYRKAQYSNISLSLMAASLIIGFFCAWKIISYNFYSFDALLPFLICGMIGVSITNSIPYGMSNILALAVMYTLWPNSTFSSILYFVLCGLVICIMTLKNRGRYDTISSCFKCCGILVVITLLFSLQNSNKVLDILFSCAAIILNTIFAFILYSVLLPILEKIFNIPTKQRLIELAFTDNAILNQLSQVAQGTYNHVKNVADLAYGAALAIGCNAELALVGARYHDIGKMVHPEYFIENQNEKNAHDQISSQLSRSIIKSHVRLGTEKGKDIGLPREVIDIIGEHHGNDIIKYFYNEAVKNAGEKDIVVKEDFMYDGNPPSTKESAIVMLADCVEAATRTIKKPNHQKYEKFINSIVSEKISHGQLDNSGLTMTELKTIKEAFITPLIGRDHHRISYDNDQDKD